MTNEQEKHLQDIKDEFFMNVDVKYRRGAREHGGDLRDMTPLQLLDNAMDECIDQYTYLKTLRDKITGCQ